MNRKERSGHRKDVFNRFASAHFNEEGYYDRDAYVRDKTAMAKEPSFSRFVPEKLIGAKYYVNYPYYPEDVRAEIVKHSKMSDKELREQSEGFNYRFEEMLAKRYKDAQKYIDIVDKVRKSSPFFEKNSQIEKAFEREFGVDIAKFKNMYPTYDDFLFHKLTGRNLSPVDNARRNATDNAVTGAKTEDTSRDGLAVIKTLDDLKKYFTGPLDVINGAMYDSRLGEPVRLKKVSDRLDRARMTPAEVADFDEALDNYAAMLLQEMMRGKKAPIDPYGYDTYSKNERARRQYIKEQAEEYRKKYGDESGLENEATGNQKN